MAKVILIKPIITEKMTRLGEQLGKYGFYVGRDANKIEIKQAVEDMYGVTVESVNTFILPAKKRSRYTKTGIITGKTSRKKKAIITLADGDTIDFFEDV